VNLERIRTRKAGDGKLLKVSIRSELGIIKDVRITGDFFAIPEEAIESIERSLEGVDISKAGSVVRAVCTGVIFAGFCVDDLVEIVEECLPRHQG
jgi:hypothetical protein